MPCSIMVITQLFLGTKTLHELGFLNINDSLAQIGLLWANGRLSILCSTVFLLALMIWFSFHLLTRYFSLVVLAQVTRSDILVF